jgi:hypothetical membrane protein
MNKKIHKILALSGIIGPLLFVLNIFIIGFFHPNYNHITQYMSELGAINAPYAIIINSGFVFGGMLIIFFSYIIFLEFNQKQTIFSIIGSILIFISGLSFLLIGFFPCDPNCVNVSTIGIIHAYLSDSAELSLIIAPIFLIKKFKEIKIWNSVFLYSILSIIFGIIFFIVYKSNIYLNHVGLFQRISFGIPLLWLIIIGIKSFKTKI